MYGFLPSTSLLKRSMVERLDDGRAFERDYLGVSSLLVTGSKQRL